MMAWLSKGQARAAGAIDLDAAVAAPKRECGNCRRQVRLNEGYWCLVTVEATPEKVWLDNQCAAYLIDDARALRVET
jgi:hypothetical protein